MWDKLINKSKSQKKKTNYDQNKGKRENKKKYAKKEMKKVIPLE